MNGLDLFSGIGGISLALRPFGIRTIAYCERDQYAQAVLLSRMRDGSIDQAPIWDDVTTIRGSVLPRVDIISGGFPCQDISLAGHKKGLGGERSGLFFQITRLVTECRPSFVFLENVPAITLLGLDRILLELYSLGYDSRWTVVSAAEVGACHIRKRWFLLAHANSQRIRQKPKSGQTWQSFGEGARITDTISSLWDASRIPTRPIAPTVERTSDGVSFRVDRHRCVGNSVVPAATAKAFSKLLTLGNGG